LQDAFDYVVVGGGASGAVIASRLAAEAANVLILEAGGTDKRLDVVIPGAVASAYKKANWKYPVEPDTSRKGAPEVWMAGKVLGGSGSINGCCYVRGNRSDYDGWAALGCDGWNYDSVLPAFKRLETWAGGANSYRGGDGPVSVVVQRDPSIANKAYYEAAQQAGYPPTDDYNGAVQDGVGYLQANHRRGQRSQASREYLKRVAAKDHLTVRTHAFVTRILMEKNKAIGVEYQHKGKTRTVRADIEVILSAGAIASPTILMLSGIGPRAELDRFGIRVASHVPGVGANLQDHPFLMQRWKSKGVRTLNKMGPGTAFMGAVDYLLHGTGFLAVTVVQVQVMTKTDPAAPSPNLQLLFAPFALTSETDSNGMFDIRLAKAEGFTASSSFMHPRSRGSISLRSSSPLVPPLINYRYFDAPEDLRDTITGMHDVQRIMSQPAMMAITDGPMEPEASCNTDADWMQYARNGTTSSYHPVGTCKMGIDDMAVVDSKLLVRGVRGLRVVDASIMPTITTGNTNAPAMMIGERAAEIILNK